VWQKVGGQVIGAFDTEICPAPRPKAARSSLVGFVLSLPGIKTGGEPRPYLHSHMMAVKEGYRNRGLGVRSSWRSAKRRSAAASATWSGPSIRSKSRTLS
jgi:predicted GNAT superfamily acetyltransferase